LGRRAIARRPFRVPGGAHETPDGLSLNMQRETNGLLTHSLAVQSNYFVVPINPVLATVLTAPLREHHMVLAVGVVVRPLPTLLRDSARITAQ
jgi:hypothetical protein